MERTPLQQVRQAALELLQAVEGLEASSGMGEVQGNQQQSVEAEAGVIPERAEEEDVAQLEVGWETWPLEDNLATLNQFPTVGETGKDAINLDRASQSNRINAADLLAIAEYLAYDAEARPMGRINWKRFSDKRPDRSNKAWASVYQRYMAEIEGAVSTYGGQSRLNMPLGRMMKGGPAFPGSNPVQNV
ncbi:hypothetical protein CALVIDRAFT_565284 [Calocera viscosa TUFC12733]|uniref:Uncharacterized protein n=1 Tax=Calocera viscosa (strain TUFC12733) TaxID=1330018 RepID=A0A167KQ62_CALVF|nr:hypothetical protein CALVIDRAFT_565284 [Calocera viscosa TUFC12733]